MKTYRLKLIVHIFILVVLSVCAGVCIAKDWWLEAVMPVAAIAFLIYFLFKQMNRSTENLKRLIDGIEYADFFISFNTKDRKGREAELAAAMNKAIRMFNERTKRQESELIFYEVLLNRVDFSIFVTDQNNHIVWLNKYAQQIFGFSSPKNINDLSSLSEELPGSLTRMTPKDVKVIRLKTRLEEHNLVVTLATMEIKGENMRVYSFKNIRQIIDDTENEAWKKLIRILTHEIMNSITPIISLSETFTNPTKEQQEQGMIQKAMRIIHRRSKGLLRFVNNYQQLTRIPPPSPKSFIVKEMVDDIMHLLKAEGILFTTRITPPDMQLFADQVQIEQVLINLIKNAAEACTNETTPFIDLEIKEEDHSSVIRITDNGSGILPEVQDKIFIPFFSTKKNGSGIGLSICWQIVRNHGGHITVAPRPEKGSMFTIRLHENPWETQL